MYFIRVSSQSVEKESDISDWKIHSYGESVDDLEGFFKLSIESEESEFHKFKHVEIVGEDGTQQVYYFQHDWLPKAAWFRLHPAHVQIAPYVEYSALNKPSIDVTQYLKSCGV